MVTDEVSGKVAVLEGEGRLGPAAKMFRKCAAWDDVVNCIVNGERRGEMQPCDMNLKEPFFSMFVFNLRVPRYALKAAVDIKEVIVIATLKSCGTIRSYFGEGCRSGVLRAGLGFS